LLRLQKVLAEAGIGSRRQCEELITAGRVTVDGQVVTELGTKVDPEIAEVRIDGEPVPRAARRLYYMLNKPTGVVSTTRDPTGRPRVLDLVPDAQRLFTVGRLDLSSEGLILITNDGPLANLLAHPRYGVEKTYQAQVAGMPQTEVLDRLRAGVRLAEGMAHAKRVTVKSQHKQSTILELVLDEGRNREIRRLLAQVGHKVLKLKRIALGPVRLGDLAPGEYRPLRREEVDALRQAAQTVAAQDAASPAAAKARAARGRKKPRPSRGDATRAFGNGRGGSGHGSRGHSGGGARPGGATAIGDTAQDAVGGAYRPAGSRSMKHARPAKTQRGPKPVKSRGRAVDRLPSKIAGTAKVGSTGGAGSAAKSGGAGSAGKAGGRKRFQAVRRERRR
jgi:23S rRNA pseudouridine2605 synthase